MADAPDPVPYEQTWDAAYGLEIGEVSDTTAQARVRDVGHLLDPSSGSVNGGVYASIAESLASFATALAVGGDGGMAMGLYNATHVVRALSGGAVAASARARERTRSEWLWDVEVTDETGALCAASSVCIAVRWREGGAAGSDGGGR